MSGTTKRYINVLGNLSVSSGPTTIYGLSGEYSCVLNSSPWALIVFEKKVPPVSPY